MTKSIQKIDNLEIEGLISSIDSNSLDKDQMLVLRDILSVFKDVCSSLQEKRMSIQRLKNLLGIKTEKKNSTRGVSSSNKDSDEKKSQKQKKAQTLLEIQNLIQAKK